LVAWGGFPPGNEGENAIGPHEMQAANRGERKREREGAWNELQDMLDDSLREVPEKYRRPLVLCYLEGKTQEVAARLLECPLGTVRSRVARGRDMLHAALVRRGLKLSLDLAAIFFCATRTRLL
jgi:RNA polymerase sigma factor (sigma-70 family)